MDSQQSRPVRACRNKNPPDYTLSGSVDSQPASPVQNNRRQRREIAQRKSGPWQFGRKEGLGFAAKRALRKVKANKTLSDLNGTQSLSDDFRFVTKRRKPHLKVAQEHFPKPRGSFKENVFIPNVRTSRAPCTQLFGSSQHRDSSFDVLTNDESVSGGACSAARKCSSRPSNEPGWERGFRKFDPLTAPELSPVKPLVFNALPVYWIDDKLIIGYSWVLSMSEQFYYDNVLSLLSQYMSSEASPDHAEAMAHAIRNNYRPITLEHMKTFWGDIRILGKGNFGVVYRITDTSSNQHLAVKHINAMQAESTFKEHTEKLLEYLHERNHLIMASKSEFMMQFKSSFSFPDISGIFLVFEWCIGDLGVILRIQTQMIRKSMPLLSNFLLTKTNELTFMKLYKFHDQLMKTDLRKFICIYIFEIFCILDFLASVNIIHRDIKPENIMIGQNLHLKLGDFGLVQNTRFITKSTQIHMVGNEEVQGFLQKEYGTFGVAGTQTYMDPETMFFKYFYIADPKAAATFLVKRNEMIDGLRLPTTVRDAEAVFMTDVWAGGMVISELLFMGYKIYDKRNWTSADKNTIGLQFENWKEDFLKLVLFKERNLLIIKNGFVNSVCGPDEDENLPDEAEFRELMYCVTSIFRARSQRCHEYSKTKQVTLVNGVTKTMAYIDLNLIEAIHIFQKRQINARTVFTIPLDVTLMNFVPLLFSEKQNPVKYSTADEWFDNLQKDAPSTQFFPMNPGYQINFENKEN